MKKIFALFMVVVFVFGLSSISYANLGDSLGELFDSVKEEVVDGVGNIISFNSTDEEEEDDGSGINITDIIAIATGSNSKTEAALDIVAYLIDQSAGGENGEIGDILRSVGELISCIKDRDPSKVSSSAGNLLNSILAIGDMSGYKTDTLLGIYESARNELANRGVIE